MLIIVATLGVILIITVGVHSSYVFYGGSRLIVAKEAYDTHTAAFAGYSNITMETNGFFVYLYYDHVFDTNQISTWADFSPNYTPSLAADWVSVQSISSAGAISFANSAIYLLLIISGLISVYAFVRLN
jgi:hypothetical protein